MFLRNENEVRYNEIRCNVITIGGTTFGMKGHECESDYW